MIRRAVLALAFVAALIAVGVYVYSRTRPTLYDFRRERPAPYAQSAYFVREFVDEWESAGIAWGVDIEGHSVIVGDYRGRWINVRDKARVTVVVLPESTPTIWLFGPSTMFGADVPDEHTIASYLQALVIGDGWRVMNQGLPGGDIVSSVVRLKQMPIKRGDTVVFYVGVAEGTNIVFGMAVDDLRRRFEGAIVEARDYTAKRGGRLIVVLQPHLYTKPLSAYEHDLEERGYLIRPGTKAGLEAAYSTLRDVSIDGVSFYDFSHVLDEVRAQGVEIYLDATHITERGNEIVANRLYEVIESR